MPLLNGSSPAIVSENIREMRNAGHPEAQAVAVAMKQARPKRAPTMPNELRIQPMQSGGYKVHHTPMSALSKGPVKTVSFDNHSAMIGHVLTHTRK